MKFSVIQKDIYPLLRYARAFTPPQKLATILHNVYIEAKEGELLLKSTNFQTSFVATLKANVEGTGVVTVPADKLADAISKLKDDANITFSVSANADDSNKLLFIKSGTYIGKFATLEPELFPQMRDITPEYSIKIKSDALVDLFRHVAFCISNDTAKPEYSGAHFSIISNKLEISSADYQRMATVSATLDEGIADEFTVNIPKKTVLDVSNIFDKAGDITIETDRKLIVFKSATISVSSKLIERYIKNITKLFQSEYPIRATINRASLIDVVGRVAATTNEISHGVRLSFNGSQLLVHSLETEHGSASDEVRENVTFNGEKMDIIFNANQLIDILKNVGSESITLAMTTAIQPALVLPDSGEAKYIIVPISIEKIG
ncbi:hypothetical protein RsTz2092_00720 [Deferribacterales bacterium RsTz2092]|nr:hypothetical protein AGMMS49941_00620 [Deferribacterales bacterium]